jgi:hypothetical protein
MNCTRLIVKEGLVRAGLGCALESDMMLIFDRARALRILLMITHHTLKPEVNVEVKLESQ